MDLVAAAAPGAAGYRDSPGVDASEIGGLYRALAARLERCVRVDVPASDQVIEDACQFAWTRLIAKNERVRREAALSWLATTAAREARKLLTRQHRHLSLEDALASGAIALKDLRAPALDELLELHERLDAIRDLSQRQQRLLWLHGIGLSYTEMASYTGCTRRTVERQLLRAKRRMRVAWAE